MRYSSTFTAMLACGGIIGLWPQSTLAQEHRPGHLAFTVQLDVIRQELSPTFCWFHPRVAAVPGAGRNGLPAVIMTFQKHLHVSDYYSGLWMMRTDDLGKTWTGPTEIPELGWVKESDGVTLAVADVTPGWHSQTGKLIAIGCSVRYGTTGKQLADVTRFSQTAYAVHDPKTGRWSKWQILELPDDDKFNMARNGCSQWLVQPDGTLLVPIYFAKGEKVPAIVTVVHCAFDGQKLTYLKHGDELSLDVVRGLCEPSLVAFQGRYYLTIRNDLMGYVTVSDDGLHYRPIKPWTFDDGSDLGSYNTQQHWLAHSGGLFLSYTRRGANNDHIPRNRAPIFLAQVDPEQLCVIRSTEKPIIPERGAMLGNFGAATITGNESWVTDAEYMPNDKPQPRGANGSVFAARIVWPPSAQLKPAHAPSTYQVSEDAQYVRIETPELAAAVCKKGYVSGVARQSFLDKKTGFRDPGFGLDIVDWIMEPGSDAAYRDQLTPEMVYRNEGDHRLFHGSRPKRSLEGPQICTKAGQLEPSIISGKDFVAIRQHFSYRTAAPGKKAGSVWTQLLVFPVGKRYFISMDKIDAVNSSEAMFLRIDMPGHVRHKQGDTFSEIYLSYRGRIPASQFFTDFPPDARFDYRRDRDPLPDRFIRGYRLRDPVTKQDGPWLVGMTLEPSVVSEAWCHQRGYVCMIEEFGGRPIRPGQSFSAAFLVGYFDTLEEANRVYDAHKGHTAMEASTDGWRLIP